MTAILLIAITLISTLVMIGKFMYDYAKKWGWLDKDEEDL